MARPKRDEGGPRAKERIVESFWQVLEVCRIDEITVERISESASCNRGSFYYHFVDIEDLADAALDDLLTGPENLPGRLFVLTTGAHTPSEVFRGMTHSVERLSLVLRRGGYERVEKRILPYIEGVWASVLCDDGVPLKDESSFIIAYTVGALLGVIERYGTDISRSTALEGLFMSEACGVALRNLCSAQKLSFDDAMGRLASLKRVDRMASSRRQHVPKSSAQSRS